MTEISFSNGWICSSSYRQTCLRTCPCDTEFSSTVESRPVISSVVLSRGRNTLPGTTDRTTGGLVWSGRRSVEKSDRATRLFAKTRGRPGRLSEVVSERSSVCNTGNTSIKSSFLVVRVVVRPSSSSSFRCLSFLLLPCFLRKICLRVFKLLIFL